MMKGRGSQIQPDNRFDRVRVEADFEHLEFDEDALDPRPTPTEFLPDSSRSIVSENDSPDVPFRYSVNPYRGCEHGCAYCYARPTHEYLGLSAGLDFETKVFVKHAAADLLRDWLARDAWKPEPICFSGVTDCYQPAEERFRLTRACLEVALEARQPVMIVTKNARVTRDLDLLSEMASLQIVSVAVSLTTLDAELARTMEPRTSTPTARLRAISELHAAGVPTRVMTAPIIPGLNDIEIPRLLEAAADAGADAAAYVLLRLPLTVRPVFEEWLQRERPGEAERVESRIRACRDGEMNNSQWGERMRGSGPIADQINQTFKVFSKRYGLDGVSPPLDVSKFRPPRSTSGQLRLF